MRKLYFLLIAVICLNAKVTATEKILKGAEANAVIDGTELIRYKDQHRIPQYIRFISSERINELEWQTWITQQFFKDRTDISFTLVASQTDKLGMVHHRYQQLLNGHPISFGIWNVHVLNNEVVSMNGVLFDQIGNQESSLTESEALDAALAHFDADTYMWELPEEETLLQLEQNDPYATYLPSGELHYINEDVSLTSVDLKLAYKFNIYAHTPLSRKEVYVDATNGDIVFENDLIHHVDTNTLAHTGYSGIRSIVSDFTGSAFRLRENGRGNGIYTFDMNNTQGGGNGDEITNNTNVWNLNGISAYALDAHFGAEMTYDYFFDNFGRNSIDGNGFQLISRVHYGVNYVNAFWDGSRMTYGDGNAAFSPLTTLDIAGHEIAHGLTNFTSNLVYQDEPGALNESFSDIFGAAVEFYALGFNNGDWLMGEDIGSAFRSLSNPNIYGDPDTYLGLNWYIGPEDNGGVHWNSGVQNFWFHLLTVGGTGTNDLGDSYDVIGIGVDDAGAIAYRNNVVYLTVTSDYEDARFYAMLSAEDLFGLCSQQLSSTGNAWYAVGIGQPYLPYVDASFASDTRGNCFLPLEVEFYDLTSNASSLIWDFGDGSTSIQTNPTHTYTQAGEYTVKLTALSTCGTDTNEIVGYIKVGPDAPCEVILPAVGVAQQQNSCNGVIYDDGGPGKGYSNDANSFVVIYPSTAGSINLNITGFDVQAGTASNCNTDYLEIYDGIGLSAPLIDRFCNSNLPTGPITSTSNAVTVRFYSDDSERKQGFTVSWDCNSPTIAPDAEFIVNTNETCNGEVQFSDRSRHGVSQWLWDFGDGNTSTQQNPLHTYAEGGVYTVKLTVSNNIGSDNITKSNLIEVTRPGSPFIEMVNLCPNEQAQFNAVGGTKYLWYQDENSTVPIAEGTQFITPALQNTTRYYVESIVEGQEMMAGTLGNGIGAGSYNSNMGSLYFDALSAFVLHSVKVYSSSTGARTIQLVKNNTVIDERTVDFPFGQHIIELDFYISPGENYQLRASGNNINLYRNTSGANYPYVLPGIVSITKSSDSQAPLDSYMYFYDWRVKEFCVSERAEALASMAICLGVDESETSNFNLFPNPSNGQVELAFGEAKQRVIKVYDMNGRIILTSSAQTNNTTLDLTHFSSGLYAIEAIDTEGNREMKRLILQ